MMDTIIRDYQAEDYQAVIDLWQKTGVGNPARGDNDVMIKKTLHHGGKFLVMLRNKSLIGTSWITNDGRRLYIHHFAIEPSLQGKGFSKPLLEESLKWAKETGLQIKLEVHKDNEIALNLYKKYAFKYLGDYQVYIIRKY